MDFFVQVLQVGNMLGAVNISLLDPDFDPALRFSSTGDLDVLYETSW